jgi:hypothetical protein
MRHKGSKTCLKYINVSSNENIVLSFFKSRGSQSPIYGLPWILRMNGLVSHTIKDVWNKKGPINIMLEMPFYDWSLLIILITYAICSWFGPIVYAIFSHLSIYSCTRVVIKCQFWRSAITSYPKVFKYQEINKWNIWEFHKNHWKLNSLL